MKTLAAVTARVSGIKPQWAELVAINNHIVDGNRPVN
jgi:hypothetical protein